MWSALRSELPAGLIERLEVFRRLLEVLSQELQAAAAALEAAAPKLRPIGLGALTYETIEREIGDWNRFQNRRQVGSYTGLCGGISASGGSVAMLSITKHGNPRLRAALIELAWRLVLWQPQSVLVRKWERVLGNVRAAMGGAGSILSWMRARPPLADGDRVHLTGAGYRRVARALHRALLPQSSLYAGKLMLAPAPAP